MKEDILKVIESKVNPLIKVWMNEGKSFVPDEYIQDKPDTRYDIDVKIMAVKYLLLEYVNQYAPYDYREKMTNTLNDVFEVDSSLFYIDGELQKSFMNVSYSFDFYLSHFYYMLMVNNGDEVDLEYVMNLLNEEEV
ncbi:hypothetical protein E1C95_23390 [Salmonella enterica subsp. enterica serovar Bonariensis]|nr:hypothetical protein [Salmonella enterica subsp. enterica serovar Bonariensis]HCZ4813744.1 hypothetical protein [Salmonella enterica subsp. enterica serovar Anatum str. CFSAN003969]HDL6709358.1 hypothetical protein [Yersinia enterocolitica]